MACETPNCKVWVRDLLPHVLGGHWLCTGRLQVFDEKITCKGWKEDLSDQMDESEKQSFG